MPQPDSLRWISPAAAADLIGVSRATLGRLLADYRASGGRRGLPHAHLGRRCVRIRADLLTGYMRQAERLAASGGPSDG